MFDQCGASECIGVDILTCLMRQYHCAGLSPPCMYRALSALCRHIQEVTPTRVGATAHDIAHRGADIVPAFPGSLAVLVTS